MQRIILYVAAAFIGGLAVGFFAANTINRSALSQQTAAAPVANTSTLNASGPANQSAGMQADVQAVLEKAGSEPQNFEAQLAAGEMYSKIGNLAKAKEFYENAAKAAPNDFDGNLAVANGFFDIREFERAGDHYQKALEFEPKDINARTDLATTYIERPDHDFDRGIKEFNDALAIDPNHEATLYNLGIAYFRKGDLENAKRITARLEEVNTASPLLARLKESIKDK